jgi:nicotinamide-nucleotide amidase
MTLAAQVLEAARKRGVTLATAESCTGGMVAAALTEIPGASDVFECGFVTYSNGAKQKMLKVRGATLDGYGAVSPEVAREMAHGALGALAGSKAGLAVSITGIAGPGSSGHKPEGRVCFATAMQGGDTLGETVEFGPRGRAQVRQAARDHALHLLLARLCA